MKRLALLAAVIASGLPLAAEDPILIFPPLPTPLKLPAGLVETLPLNKTASFFGDALRAVDCTDDADLPYGICGNQLFGGVAMTDSHLQGNLTIQFYPPLNNVSHFVVQQHVMSGDDTVLTAPLGFQLQNRFNTAGDALQLSSGDVDLTTGGVTNLKWYVIFTNTALAALLKANPKLDPQILAFPGVRGHAYAKFTQRADGLLDFMFRGSTFLALGKEILGEMVRFPLPPCGPDLSCATVPARGTSLHPHLYLSTAEPEGLPCGSNCPEIPTNTAVQFTINTYASSFGDNFDLDIPQLGGPGPGRSHVQGNLQIQFGPRSGDTVSFVITSTVPTGLFATPPVNSITGRGVQPGLLGQNEILKFPLQTYLLQNVVLADEPYNFPHGAINLNTGRVIGEMVYPSFYGQTLANALFAQNAGRISTDPFFLVAANRSGDSAGSTYALFEKGPNGETLFRYAGEHRRSFATFRFPSPDYIFANSWIGGPKASLDLFLNLQAARRNDSAVAVKTGNGGFKSSLGDTVTYNYSIPCSPAGASFSFQYTNGNTGTSGGTFTLKRLAAVSCTNSRNANVARGDYDTVTFSGFGTWSKDASGASPRFMTAQISIAPDAPYAGFFVYQSPDTNQNVVLSSANNKPATAPAP